MYENYMHGNTLYIVKVLLFFLSKFKELYTGNLFYDRYKCHSLTCFS